MNLQRREEIRAIAERMSEHWSTTDARDAISELLAHIDTLEQTAAERVIADGRARAVVYPKCEPIQTSGQREKDVWNDGFAHGWRVGFDGAHDLLEALEGLKMLLLEWHKELPDHVGDKEGAYIDKASAAIAKARSVTDCRFVDARMAVPELMNPMRDKYTSKKIDNLQFQERLKGYLLLNYDEWVAYMQENRESLCNEESQWASVWELWDFSNSPMNDEIRLRFRYIHYCAFFSGLEYARKTNDNAEGAK